MYKYSHSKQLSWCVDTDNDLFTSSKINNLSLQQKIPIIVGGTHYYVESLLWKHYLIENENATNNEHELNENNNNSTITEDDTDTTYHKLLEVDPLMAEKIHPNEKRKIKRSLEVILLHRWYF